MKCWNPGCDAEHLARRRHDLARHVVQPRVAGQEARLARAGQEAEVLGLGAASHRQLGRRGQRAHLGLGQLGQREPHPRQRRRRQRGEHVGLVLRRVGGDAQQPVGRHPRVVPRGQIRGAKRGSEREHLVQPHVPVAAHARVRGLPRRVAGQERVDDARPELRPQVQREVRQAHAVRDRAREPHGVGRAAGRRRRRSRRPPTAPSVTATAPAARRATRRPRSPRRRSSPPARDRHRTAPKHRRAPRRPARDAARRRPDPRRAACPARARRAPPRSTARPRARRPAPSASETSDTAAEPAAVSAPQPEASNDASTHAIADDPHGDADQVAAERAAGGAVEAPGKHDAAPDGRGEVFTEALAIHERRVYDRRLIAQSVRPASLKSAVELAHVARGERIASAAVVGLVRGLDGLGQRRWTLRSWS